ncbi:hypothetical protein DSCO28_14680 [Desulfosarcina ovata subsp. sediminis]|uniref:Uncharacterized protein n=1 Tax=Desulfosarcina ovata subsp. sediminis TaxID=885957 RepID=A0A5K7ZFP6_9BACT|nr:hypothetical protein DSCO28_14680 [Desulfosarcina ovata subsp. sediminis]
MDGWKATRNAWQALFPAVVIVCCFLHVFIKIRDRAKKKYRDIFEDVASKLWVLRYCTLGIPCLKIHGTASPPS